MATATDPTMPASSFSSIDGSRFGCAAAMAAARASAVSAGGGGAAGAGSCGISPCGLITQVVPGG